MRRFRKLSFAAGVLATVLAVGAVSCNFDQPIPEKVVITVPSDAPGQVTNTALPIEKAKAVVVDLGKNTDNASKSIVSAEVDNKKVEQTVTGTPQEKAVLPLTKDITEKHKNATDELVEANAKILLLNDKLDEAQTNNEDLTKARVNDNAKYTAQVEKLKETYDTNTKTITTNFTTQINDLKAQVQQLKDDENDPVLFILKGVKILLIPAMLLAAFLMYQGRMTAAAVVAGAGLISTAVAEALVRYHKQAGFAGAILCGTTMIALGAYGVIEGLKHAKDSKATKDDLSDAKTAVAELTHAVYNHVKAILPPDQQEKVFGSSGILATQISSASKAVINDVATEAAEIKKVL